MPAVTTIFLIRVGQATCALRLDEVREILPMPRLARWPGLPVLIEGFFNLGGRAVAAVDGAMLFGLGRDSQRADENGALYRHLVLLGDQEEREFALIVDRVTDAVAVMNAELLPVEEGLSLNGCVVGEIRVGDNMVPLLDPARIFSEKERGILDVLTEEAEARELAWQGTVPP